MACQRWELKDVVCRYSPYLTALPSSFNEGMGKIKKWFKKSASCCSSDPTRSLHPEPPLQPRTVEPKETVASSTKATAVTSNQSLPSTTSLPPTNVDMAAPEVQSTRSSSASTSKIQTAEKRDSFTSSNGYHESNGTNGYNGMVRSNGYGSSSPVLHSPTSSTTKTSILRERTIRMTQSMRVRFGGSSDMFLDNISSFEDFLDAVADQRLRFMPHSGSKWDKVLRWAEGFCTYVYGFHHIVHTFMLHSEDASRMIWNSVLALLEMGPRHIKVLTKVFSVLNRLGMSITLLLRQELLLAATSEIRRGLAHAYSDLMELTCAISMHYVGKSQGDQRIDMEDFNDQFNVYINAYYQHRDHVADALWSVHMKSISEAEMVNFHDIRSFLEPSDRSVQKLMMGRHSLGSERAEFTCEWFNYHLNDFVIRNNKMLLITGPSGCGKTMLSDWIVESLRGSMESDQYDVVFYRVWTDIPETTSTLSLVKDLFMQTLNRNIGDEVLISSARRAMDMASNGSPAAAVEKVLWEGLAHVASHSKLMIVVDGLDQISGDQHAVLDHLHFVAAADRHSKVIVLSRPLQKPAPSKTQHLSINEKNILHDIQLLIESRMDENDRMSGMNITDKKEIAQKIAEKSHGSFLWADCAFQCLKHERTPSGFMQWLARAPKSIEHFVDHHVNELQLADAETRAILSWILAAHRPLAVTEIKQLLEIDTKNHTISVRYDDVTETIRHAVGPLVDIVEGHVCLKHPSFRPHLVEFQTEKFKFDVKKAQSSLTLRLLAYVKHYVHEDTDVAWRPARPYEARTYFDSHALLEYATRYWVDHFRVSRFYSTEQKTEIDVRLRKCWPSSTLLAVLEGACFGWGTVSVERETNQRVAFEMRKTILGMHATATLQSMVFLIQHYTQTRRTEVTSLAYEAWQISRTISSSDTTVALECAHAFVVSTESLTVKKRTEVVTRKEEMLQYLIATHKRTGGVSHERTIRYTKTLAELYVSISETDRAVSLYRDLYNVSIERYGYFHEETTAVYNTLVQYLKATNRHDTVLEIVRDYHAYVCKTLSVNDERRVKSTMNLVAMYEERKEVAKAEEVLVSYWKSVMTSSKSSSTSIETKVDVAVEYSRFLRRHQRTEEAEAVMRGVYSEVVNTTEESRQESSSVFKRVKAIAQEFKSLKSFSMARSIYSRLWEQTKSSSSTESSSMSEEVATELAETVSEEITTKTETTTMSTSNFSTLTTEDESTLREVFQSSLSMSSSNKSMSSSVIKTGMALSSSYYKKEQYHEAATTYSQILSKTWSSIETRESSVQEHSEEMIEVAMSLAECCFQQLQIERSETIYRNVFRTLLLRSSKNSSHHEWVVRKARAVIEYHKRIYRFDAAVTYYHDLCLHLHQRLGKAHSTTIEMFIEYGTLARKLGRRKDAVEAFRHIHLAFKHEEGCILRKGVEPSLTLCELYEQDHAWSDARNVYAALWLTVTTHAKDFDLREWVEVVYERYRFVLEKLSTGKKEEYEALRQVAVEYTATCKTLYGEKHERTVRATLQLAELCERSEAHREEAVRLYEEALKQSSKTSMTTTRSNSSQSTSQTSTSRTTTTTTTVSSLARHKLAKIYSSKETSSSRAVSLHEEQLASTRAEYGASSSESLTATRELVSSYKRQNTTESTSKAVSTLRSSVLEIFKSERSSERVFEAARSLAQTYVAHGFKAEAASVAKELRSSIFQQLRETKRSESSLAVFLAAFEETAVGKRSFSAAMADIRSEIFLYSAYFEALSSSSTKSSTSMHITTILSRGVRLRTFLLESERTDEAKRVEEELFAKFAEHMSVESTTTVVDKQTHRTTLEAFFSIFLSNMSDSDDSEDSDDSNSTQISITIIEHAVNTVREYANAARYANALALAALVQRYVALVGGFASGAVVHAVARLCLYLAGRGTEKNSCKQADAALYARCLDLSRALLRHALEACATLGISLTDMAVTELNEIVVVLGDEQRSYEVLEHVLQALWHDRTVHRTWSTQLVLAIGLRLTETRAAQGRIDDAIHLAEDIRYNLHRVYGPLDVATLQFTMLLSSLYTTRGRHSEAVHLHEHALTRLANGVGAKEDGEDGVSGSADESAKAALAQLEGAQKCIAAAGGWNGAGVDAGRFRELFGELSQKYGSQRAWGERKMAPVEKWPMKVDAKAGAGWKAPETFSLTAVGYDGAKEGGVGLFDGAVAGRAKRASALRKVSNHVAMHGSRASSYGSQMSQLPVRAV